MKNDITVISANDPEGAQVMVVDTKGHEIKGVSVVAFKENGNYGYFIQFVLDPQTGLAVLAESTDADEHKRRRFLMHHRSDDFDVVNKKTGLVVGSYRQKCPLDEF